MGILITLDTPFRHRYNLPMPSRELEDFIARWSPSGGGERSNYQLFLSELCDLLGVPMPDPAAPDDTENVYVFDRGIARQEADGSITTNFIDLYKRGFFICETKQGVEAAVAAVYDRRSNADSVLKQIHDDFDVAVLAAYGWPANLADEEILERLVALNHERTAEILETLVALGRARATKDGRFQK